MLVIMFKTEQRRIYNHVDLLNITAADYSIYLSNLPTDSKVTNLVPKILKRLNDGKNIVI